MAHQLGDTEAAERYCVEVDGRRKKASDQTGVDSDSGNNELFLLLLQVYLKGDSAPSTDARFGVAADEGKRANNTVLPSPLVLAAAVSLLTKHFHHISPVAALALLPPSTPITLLHAYLCRLLRSLQHSRRSAAITRALYRVQNIDARLELLDAGRDYVVMEDSRENGAVECVRCHRRIGMASFARQPDGSIMHYLCYRQVVDGLAT